MYGMSCGTLIIVEICLAAINIIYSHQNIDFYSVLFTPKFFDGVSTTC